LALEPKRRLGRGLDALLGAYPAEPELRVAADGGRGGFDNCVFEGC